MGRMLFCGALQVYETDSMLDEDAYFVGKVAQASPIL